MGKLLDRLGGAGAPLLWLDDTEYSARLLAGGDTPWLDATRWVAFRQKATGLLRPDVLAVPVAPFARAWVGARPEFREAMAAKKRAVAPARTLLADDDLRAHLAETVRGLRAAIPNPPLALVLPSPRAFVAEAHALAFGGDAPVEIGEDEIDACAVHVADFLRAFGECGVDALLLEERATDEPRAAAELSWYRPVTNVAAHHRLDLGLRLPSAAGFSGAAEGVAFVIAPRAVEATRNGIDLGDDFWSGAAAPGAPDGGFRFATVPADAVPERVLERLSSLR